MFNSSKAVWLLPPAVGLLAFLALLRGHTQPTQPTQPTPQEREVVTAYVFDWPRARALIEEHQPKRAWASIEQRYPTSETAAKLTWSTYAVLIWLDGPVPRYSTPHAMRPTLDIPSLRFDGTTYPCYRAVNWHEWRNRQNYPWTRRELPGLLTTQPKGQQ